MGHILNKMWTIVRCIIGTKCVFLHPKYQLTENTNNLSILHTMDKTLSQRFGSTVVRLRKERGISQENFANQSSIDRHYMSDIENGRRNISLDIIEKIAKSLQLPISVLFSEVEKG